jgi:hypothetical protein
VACAPSPGSGAEGGELGTEDLDGHGGHAALAELALDDAGGAEGSLEPVAEVHGPVVAEGGEAKM